MSSKITNYSELMEEEQRLLELLKIQKMRIEADITELKEEAKPVIDVFSFTGKLVSRNKDNALINTIVDLLIARMFSKSGFLVWLIFPTILSNLSSHYVPRLIPAVRKLMSKKRNSTDQINSRPKENFIPALVYENGHKEEVLH